MLSASSSLNGHWALVIRWGRLESALALGTGLVPRCGITRAHSLVMRLLRSLTILALAGGMLAYGQAQKSAPQGGEAIYRQKCGGCHGLDGKAETTMGKTWKIRDLTSPEFQKQPDSEIAGTI